MLISNEKILAEYGKVIIELIERDTLTDADKANILETLQKLTVDLRNNGSNGQYNECEVGMLCFFGDAIRYAKKDSFPTVADCIKKALDCYNYYQQPTATRER